MIWEENGNQQSHASSRVDLPDWQFGNSQGRDPRSGSRSGECEPCSLAEESNRRKRTTFRRDQLPVAPAATTAAASAAASAATTTAVAATPTAATTAARSSSAAPAATAFTLRTGFVYDDLATLKIFAVQRGYRFFRFAVVGNLYESETSRLAREPIPNQRYRSRRDTIFGEQSLNVFFRGLKRKIAHIQFLHWLLLRPLGRNAYARLKRQYLCRGQSKVRSATWAEANAPAARQNLAARCLSSQHVSVGGSVR
jgi:hypothetical protein